MNNYEAMFIIKSDLAGEARESAFKDIASTVTKGSGKIINQQIWAEKRRLAYSIKKSQEGSYYLMQFEMDPSEIVKLRQIWKLNENVLRFQILKASVKK